MSIEVSNFCHVLLSNKKNKRLVVPTQPKLLRDRKIKNEMRFFWEKNGLL